MRCRVLLSLLAAAGSYTTAPPAVVSAAGEGHQCLTVTMSTPGDCVDTPSYVDSQSYGCAENADYDDCWVDNIPYGYTTPELLDLLANCPATCNLCSETETMAVELFDYSTGVAPVFSLDTTFTGIGPPFGADEGTAVTQTVCLSRQSCYKIAMVTPTVNFMVRTRFEVATASDGVVIASGEGYSKDGASFCLADCPPDDNTAFDVDSGTCKVCDKGMINEGGFCVECKAGTYLERGGVDGSSARCEQCPAPNVWSPDGALSVLECFPIETNLYAVSYLASTIFSFHYDEDSYSVVVANHESLDCPNDIVFITPTLFVATTFGQPDTLSVWDVDGTLQGTVKLADVAMATALAKLPSIDSIQLVVSDWSSGQLHVVDLGTFFDDEGKFLASGDDEEDGEDESMELTSIFISLEGSAQKAWFITLGETDDEMLVASQGFEVHRVCITSGETCAASRNGRILLQTAAPADDAWQGFLGIATIRTENAYLISEPAVSHRVLRCDIAPDDPENAVVETSCSTFASFGNSIGVGSAPTAIYVDTRRELVYIADKAVDEVLVFTYQGGDPVTKLGKKTGSLRTPSAFAIRPGYYAPFTTVTLPAEGLPLIAGVPIRVPFQLHDVHGQDATTSDTSRFSISAMGSAVLMDGTPNEVTVKGLPVVLAGSGSKAAASDSALSAEIVLRTAGNWTVSIIESGTAVPSHLSSSSPFPVLILPAETAAAMCKSRHNSSIVSGETWRLLVDTYDEYSNPTDDASDEFVAWFDDRKSSLVVHHRLERTNTTSVAGEGRQQPASFAFEKSIYKTGSYAIRVKHVGSDTELAESPFSVSVFLTEEQLDRIAAEAERETIVVAVCVLAAVLVVSGAAAFAIWRRGKVKIAAMRSQQRVLKVRVSEKEHEIQNKAEELREKESEIQSNAKAIQDLNESLRKKKHTEEELEVMKEAMESMGKAKSDELRGVLVNSKDVTICNMLGKGGFGVVHLGEYKGEAVAVKQLLAISPENVDRFRFECFLMKNLRHPYIVRLVGVCWDETMLACLLEFVSNGSLEDHLKKDRDRASENKMTWKGKLLRVATQCALGVQYLHNSRYFDEKKDCWKDCIIHRDLKPDNILVTHDPDFTAKLTDFGESRSADLNLTMTQVGTPIYIAPEIIRNDHYCSKIDTYSFSIILVAMMRAEKDVVAFFFEALRKHMKKKNTTGIGINILNNRMMNQNFRPELPKQLYPSLKKLIQECWSNDPAERPSFDDVVTRLSGIIAHEVDRMPEPDVTAEEGAGENFTADDENHDQDDGQLVAQLKKRIAGLEAERGSSIDEWAQKNFVKVSKQFLPPPTEEERSFLVRSLALLQEDPRRPFVPFTKLDKKHPDTKMFTRSDASGVLWGKSYGDVEAGLEKVFSWVWDVCSNERTDDHKRANGNLVRKTDASFVSRSQIMTAEYRIAPGISNRWGISRISWFKLENGWNGNEAFVMMYEPAEVVQGRDYGVNEAAVLCAIVGVYLFESIGPDTTRFTMIQSANMGGLIPKWVVDTAIMPVHLAWVADVQNRFKRVQKNLGVPAAQAKGAGEETREDEFSNRVYAEILAIKMSLEKEVQNAKETAVNEGSVVKLTTLRDALNEEGVLSTIRAQGAQGSK